LTQAVDGVEVTSDIDLTDIGYLVPHARECRTGTCSIRSGKIGSDGFLGTYGVTDKLEEVVAGRRLSSTHIHEGLRDHAIRRLAVLEQTEIFNPIYCMYQNDTFLFQIDSPNHYPVYMKNSVINSNPDFDFGAFQTLETEIRALKNQNLTDPVIFTFTFSDPGTYVFNDAANEKKIMIITVKGLGEECADPDRYVQTVSEDSLAQVGATINEDLIVEPNYPLIIALGLILVFSTGIIMIFVGYCLHKNWTMPTIIPKTYRDFQVETNIHPEESIIFTPEGNDFDQFKSDLIDSEEDDLDNFNLDIQQDLVGAGEKYLKMFKKRKDQHKTTKRGRRSEIKALIDEIEALIKMLGDSAMSSNMHWLDLNADTDLTDDKMKEKIEQEL
jgi:hypothetical protein